MAQLHITALTCLDKEATDVAYRYSDCADSAYIPEVGGDELE